jgi:hypothetical protein
MYEEERYQVKYFLLMLEPIKKVLIGVKENATYAKLEKELEREVEAFYNASKTHYPKSTVFINFEIVKKEGNLYQPNSMPVEVCH